MRQLAAVCEEALDRKNFRALPKYISRPRWGQSPPPPPVHQRMSIHWAPEIRSVRCNGVPWSQSSIALYAPTSSATDIMTPGTHSVSSGLQAHGLSPDKPVDWILALTWSDTRSGVAHDFGTLRMRTIFSVRCDHCEQCRDGQSVHRICGGRA